MAGCQNYEFYKIGYALYTEKQFAAGIGPEIHTACRDKLYRNVVIPYKMTYMDYEVYTDQKGHIP